jgi:DNA-binding CsgD family transcriptional regulator
VRHNGTTNRFPPKWIILGGRRLPTAFVIAEEMSDDELVGRHAMPPERSTGELIFQLFDALPQKGLCVGSCLPLQTVALWTYLHLAIAGMGMTDTQEQFQELTDKQKECLRLVSHNYSSKEIGRKLGVSPYAVDQRLRIATRNLGVDSRFEAARLLAATEQMDAAISEPLIYQPPHVLAPQQTGIEHASSAHRDQSLDAQAGVLRDAGVATWPPRESLATWDFRSISEPGGFQRPYSIQVKAMIAFAIALLSLIAFGAAVTALEVLSRLN